MVKRSLFALLLINWAFVALLGRWLPWASGLTLLFVVMIGYALLVTVAMVHRKRRERKYPPPPTPPWTPRVSLVVPAHNEEQVIEETVAALMALDYPDFHVLVMDDRSADGTAARLAALAQRYDPARFAYHVRAADGRPGKSAVLNDALAMTDGEIIAVFDADAFVAPDFISRMLPFLAEEGVGGAQARKVIANADYNWLTRCQNYEYSLDSHFQYGRDAIRCSVEFRGNGQLVKRSAIESVGGWNEASLTDDLDLSTRFQLAGWDVRFAHKTLVYEEGITRLSALIRQRRRWAQGSLTRYLQFGMRLLASDQASLRAKGDLLAYVVQFIFPLWLVFDYCYLGYHYVTGQVHQIHMLSSLMALPVLCGFFYTALVVAIYRFNRPGVWRTLSDAVMTAIYFILVWIPVVCWVTVNLIREPQGAFDWGKTEHGGAGRRNPALSA
ncbi:MAG: glycosyltransferase family 2 protein [Vampirovibrionales bacterium]|nr:glycosyltransferase family 2 protein [Vampirovibrionales bacterium]